jgi:hypothetical protein
MSDEQKLERAKEYVDKQLQTMEQYGSAPKDLSDQEYRSLIEDVAEKIEC